MAIHLWKLPIFPQSNRYPPSAYRILNGAKWLSYILKLCSPGLWLMVLFQDKDEDGKFYTNPTASEYYQVLATFFPLAILIGNARFFPLPLYISWVCAALAVECVQYQFWNVIVRPALDPLYKRYSTPRTLLIILLQYFQLIFIFAVFYGNLFPNQFHVAPSADAAVTLSPRAALEFSVVTMTTVGFGSIYAEPGSNAALMAAGEALCGVFGLGLMLATIASGLREVKDVPRKT